MKKQIIQHIQKNGPLSVADYMQMCLYTPKTGYYMKGMPFGHGGDFITAPELTPLFGEMLGLWVAATWQQMGAPEHFNLVEFGPGRGTLCADMLRAISKALPPCFKALSTHLVDISPNLTDHQKSTLKEVSAPLYWHKTIKTVPFDAPCIVLGNELLDAFPINQYELHDGQYYERLVTTNGQDLFFTLAPHPTNLAPHTTPVVEKSPALEAFLNTLKASLKRAPQAALLFIDYGGEGHTSGDTLQALRSHTFESIFANPSHADLTWHIPFGHISAILGAKHAKITDMALFLTEIGFALRAEQAHRAAKTQAEKEHIQTTTQRLLNPNQMGAHFKVLGWSKSLTDLQGFQHAHAYTE